MSASGASSPKHIGRRLYGATNLGIFLLSLLALVVSVNFFAMRSQYRVQLDATKTRAYSLSPQTQTLLADLDGSWTVALLISPTQVDPAVRRQIDEVLRRFTESAPDLNVQLIDPADPGTLADYDALLLRLQSIYADLVGEYDVALDAGEEAFAALQGFAQQQTGSLQSLLSRLPPAEVASGKLQARAMAMDLLATEGGQVTQLIRDDRGTSDVQPIPDYEGARSTLVAALTDWSNQLLELALLFEGWRELPGLEPETLNYLTAARGVYDQTAQQLATAADPLARLAPLELSSIGQLMQEGECALVIGPEGASAIRSAQLFPKTNISVAANAAVSFDQRFRGEHLIASTIRALLSERMPRVVFVHGDEHSLLRPADNRADLSGLKHVLTMARFEVVEWAVARNMPRPESEEGQPIVWVVIPPTVRESLETSEGEQRLLAAVGELIADGEPVMLNVYPSPIVRFGQRDPWQAILAEYGVSIDTARTIFELIGTADGESVVEHGQAVQEFRSAHAIARAVDGLPAYFGLPMRIQPDPSRVAEITMTTIVAIDPSPTRWMESEWFRGAEAFQSVQLENRFEQPVPIVMAVERPHPLQAGSQRAMVVSSGGWMLSYVADRVYSIGGDRVALEYPGNFELFLASVAWLAGVDELIAPSPVSQEVARLRLVTPEVRSRWMWLTVAGLPGVCIAMGLMMWLARRF